MITGHLVRIVAAGDKWGIKKKKVPWAKPGWASVLSRRVFLLTIWSPAQNSGAGLIVSKGVMLVAIRELLAPASIFPRY